MNKVLNINLGGYPFTIDDIAYEHLSQYLKAIRQHFSHSEGCEEIMSDIEARIAELFQESLGGRPIVTTKDIETAIAVMGKPEDFGAEAFEGQASDTKQQSQGQYKTGRRLFRDPDHKVVGGVCSGIAAYFGLEDPLWIRLAFVAAFFLFGFAFPLYIILLIIIPKAETAGDRLAMRGEPINVSNIARIVEQEVENLSEKLSELGSKGTAGFTYNKDGAKRALEEGISAIGGAMSYVIQLLGRIVKPFVLFFGGILILVLAALWIAFFGTFASNTDFVYSFVGSKGASFLAFFNSLMVVGIPIAGLVLMVMRMFYRVSINNYWRAGLWSFWLLNLISLGITGARIAADHQESATERKTTILYVGDTLVVEPVHPEGVHHSFFNMGVRNDELNLFFSRVRVRIEESDNGQFQMVQENSAKGSNEQEASRLANSISCKPELKNGVLFVPESVCLPKGTRFRDQHMSIIVKVPKGKYIRFGEGFSDLNLEYQYDDDFPKPDDLEGYTWQMTGSGLICPDWIRENNAENQMNYKDFDKLQITGYLKVEIKQGSSFDVKLTGNKRDVKEHLRIVQMGSTLNIRSDMDDNGHPLKLVVTLPDLQSLDLDHTQDATVEGFKQAGMSLTLTGDMKVKLFSEVEKMEVNQEGGELELNGTGDRLVVKLEDGARLEATRFKVKTARVDVSDGGEAKVAVSDVLEQEGPEGNIEVKGSPTIKKKEE